MPLADDPTTWQDPPAVSLLHELAIFAGIPLLVILMVALLVYAPSLVHGPRYRPGQPWEVESARFGSDPSATAAAGELGTGPSQGADPTPEASPAASGRDTGGASASW